MSLTTQTTPTASHNAAIDLTADFSTEAELVHRVRAGDEWASAFLVRIHSERMLAVARRMLHCEEDCADAVQEAFICAFQSIGDFKAQCRLSTWLHRIVVNACLMRLRSRAARPTVSLEDVAAAAETPASCRNCSSPCEIDGSSAVAEREVQLIIRACIDHLPKSYRDVLMLRDIQE
jgi:RNA polymerase sigma-70 factor, ECF subfamily